MIYSEYRTSYAVIPNNAVEPATVDTATKALLRNQKEFRLPDIEIKWYVPLECADEKAFPILEVLEGSINAKVLHKITPENSPIERKRKQEYANVIYVNAQMDLDSVEKAVVREAVRIYLCHYRSNQAGN